MNETHVAMLVGASFGLLAYPVGLFVGRIRHHALVERQLQRAADYQRAVDDLDRWCGYTSPHARLIARHLKALGEGSGYNAGTPVADEACHVSGLRVQLTRLDYHGDGEHPIEPRKFLARTDWETAYMADSVHPNVAGALVTKEAIKEAIAVA